MKHHDLHIRFDNVFFEKTRLSILTVLYQEKEISFKRFLDILETTEGRLYSHINKLLEIGYITAEKNIVNNKLQTTYKLTKIGEEKFREYINFIEDFLKHHT